MHPAAVFLIILLDLDIRLSILQLLRSSFCLRSHQCSFSNFYLMASLSYYKRYWMLASAVQRAHQQAGVIFFTNDFPIGKQCWIFRINSIYEVYGTHTSYIEHAVEKEKVTRLVPKNLGWGRQENNICFYRFSLLLLSTGKLKSIWL